MFFSPQLGSSPQSFAPLVERVDAEDDGVLVYLKEVRLYTWYITSCHFLIRCCSSFCLAGSQRRPHELHSAAESGSCSGPMSYTLQLNQVLAVENLKPAVIKVYDYYQTSMLSNRALLWLISLRTIWLILFLLFQVIRLRLPTHPPVHDLIQYWL